MDLSTYAGNKILEHMLKNTTWTSPTTVYVSAHTADPALVGSNELTGASYARASMAFASASAKVIANSAQVSLTMPSSGGPFDIPYLGLWDASSSGNFLARIPLLGTALECTAATSDTFDTGVAHGWAVDDRVIFDNLGGSLPTGITSGTVYFLKTASGSTFTLAATSGGTTIDITVAGGAIVRKCALQRFNNANILQVAASALTFSL